MKPGSQSGTYEDDIFEVIANLHVLRCKFGEKMGQFGGKSFLKLSGCYTYFINLSSCGDKRSLTRSDYIWNCGQTDRHKNREFL